MESFNNLPAAIKVILGVIAFALVLFLIDVVVAFVFKIVIGAAVLAAVLGTAYFGLRKLGFIGR